MDIRLTALLGVGLLSLGYMAQAQDFDDIYYDGSESPKPTEKVITTPVRTSQESKTTISATPRRYRIPVNTGSSASRSDDEYNRRGAYSREAIADSLANDTSYMSEGKFANTERIERFYDPNVVTGSGDDELITLYYDTTPTVSIVIGNTFPSYGWGWGAYIDPWYSTWYGPSWRWNWGWYSPWYSSWYNPWYGSSWAWHYSWCDPWFGGWGWHHPWHDAWYRPGDHYWGHNYYAGNGRRPNGGTYSGGTNLNGGRRPGYSTAMGSRRPSSTPSYGNGGNRYGSSNVSGGRPGYAAGRNMGNVGSGTSYSRRPSSSVTPSTTYGQGRPGYATQQTPRTTYESRPATTRSYERSSSSPSSNWGGGRSSGSYSSGGFSGGHSGGGFSGGGGRRR